MDKKRLNIGMGMDSYLPTVDGVVMCMHNYCLNASREHNVTALVPKNTKSHVDNYPYKVLRCKSMYIPIAKYFYGVPSIDGKFKKEVYNMDFDILHMHSPFNMSKFAIKLAKKKNIPIVSTFHTNFRPIFQDVLGSNAMAEAVVKSIGKVYNQMDEVFVCSPYIAEQARSFGYKGKITILPFGTELERADNVEELRTQANEKLGLNPDELVFLYVGRVVPLKRIDFSIRSLKTLKDKGIKFKFLVVGKGLYQKDLEALAKDLGLENEVKLMGFVDRELLPYINARADLLLFPSLYDNFGLVKVEAAAYSTPGVYIEDTPAGYGVTDGQNGYLSADNQESFTAKILEAISDRAKLKQVGINASKELYIHWSDCTKQLIKRYYEIIEEKKQKLAQQEIASTQTTKQSKKQKQKLIDKYYTKKQKAH
ncbi:MAG: glycosyltransferase [Clostridia bacterium]|nr:glycosyltransferase [Clostridia bacterium]